MHINLIFTLVLILKYIYVFNFSFIPFYLLFRSFSIIIIWLDHFRNLYPDKQLKLDKLQTHLLETSHEIGALKVWQFQELSHQAAERIMNSPTNEAINVLTDISQNFPMQVNIFLQYILLILLRAFYAFILCCLVFPVNDDILIYLKAKSLIRTKVNNEMKKEMKLNQAMFSTSLNIQPTDTALFINGLFFDLEAVDVLSLLESLRSELRVMESLRKIGTTHVVLLGITR